MSSLPNTLPIEARQAAWSALWRRLLQPIPNEPEPDDEREQGRDDEAA